MSSGKTEKIYGINGPVIYLKGKTDFKMSEMVHVGEEKLVGEVISLDKDRTTVQVYEETSGLHPGELVEGTGAAVSVTLAPGILNNIFDGIERPLERIADKGGAFITRGVSVDALDRQKALGDAYHSGGRRYGTGWNDHCGSAGDAGYRAQMYGSSGRGRNCYICGSGW